jgi:nucleoid DNA-binding protein
MPAEKLYVSPKEEILKLIAKDMELPIETIEKVISWSYMKANHAIREHTEVEPSGLGKFYVSQAKVRRRIAAIESSMNVKDVSPERLEELKQEMEFVKTKQK